MGPRPAGGEDNGVHAAACRGDAARIYCAWPPLPGVPTSAGERRLPSWRRIAAAITLKPFACAEQTLPEPHCEPNLAEHIGVAINSTSLPGATPERRRRGEDDGYWCRCQGCFCRPQPLRLRGPRRVLRRRSG